MLESYLSTTSSIIVYI